MEHDIIGFLLNTQNAIVMLSVGVIIETVKRALPQVWAHEAVRRTSRLWPMLLCVGALFIPGVAPASIVAGQRVLLGIVLGAFAGQFHGLVVKNLLRKKETNEHN